MAEVEALFSEFIEQHLGGENPDPFEFLSRLEGEEREELGDLIDAYYVDAPVRAWDAEAYRGSSAERIAERVDRAFAGVSGGWPVVLPTLRDRASLQRRALVESLADRLDVADKSDRVDEYYHQMEWGQLPAEGVDDRVLEALGALVDAPARWLRQVGSAFGTLSEGGASAEGPLFARTAHDALEAPMAASPGRPEPEDEWDEVDELFRGG